MIHDEILYYDNEVDYATKVYIWIKYEDNDICMDEDHTKLAKKFKERFMEILWRYGDV